MIRSARITRRCPRDRGTQGKRRAVTLWAPLSRGRQVRVIGGGIGDLTAALSREPLIAVWGGSHSFRVAITTR